MDDIYISRDKNKPRRDISPKSPTADIPPLPPEFLKPYPASPSRHSTSSTNPPQRTQGNQQRTQGNQQRTQGGQQRTQGNQQRTQGGQQRTQGSQQRTQSQPYQHTAPVRKRRKKKSVFGRLVRLVFTLFLILVILFGCGYVYALGTISSSDYNRTETEQNQYIEGSSLCSDKAVKNILLLGVDSTSGNSSRSDTMLLMSLDNRNGKIKLTSFLRDTWIEIPGVGKAKMNASCSHGGAQLVMDTIEYNYKIDIDNYLLVDFNMFTNIIDSLGGITLEVTEKEASYINRTTRHTISSGENILMNGDVALVYCRIRKLDSDFMRTYRQRKVINAIIDKVKTTNPAKLIGIGKEIISQLETDLSPLGMTNLAVSGVFKLIFFDTVSLRLPADKTWDYDKINGQSVITCNIDENATIVQDFIYQNDLTYSDYKDGES